MCTGAEIIPLVVAAASAGAGVYNTNKTLSKQDAALAQSIRNQAGKQQKADARVNEEIAALEASRSTDERNANLAAYTDSLRKNSKQMTAGLTPTIGGAAFVEGSKNAATDVNSYAGKFADLMSRIDAASDQRRGEGVGMGRAATDLSLIAREAEGQAYLDKLKYDKIRRNPWLDALSQVGMAYAGAKMPSGGFSIKKPASVMKSGMSMNVSPSSLNQFRGYT